MLPNGKKIAAGITLFNPEIERLKENITATLCQVEHLYLVDNNSNNTAGIKVDYSLDERVTVISNDENSGVAAALNQMCNAAAADGYRWILTLDQDSLPETDIIEKYLPFTENEEVALITPKFDDDNEPDMISSAKEEPFTFIERCNTSASLVRLSVFAKVGGFDEKMFIDCVDFDYCTTLLENGYKILRVNDAVLHHRLGEASEVKFFIPIGRLFGIKKLQKSFFTYNHSPLRTYYYARNIRYYAYKHKDFIDLKTEKRVYIKWLVLKLGFERQKFQKLKAILKGKKDAKKMINDYLK